jgi:hypothetical protein
VAGSSQDPEQTIIGKWDIHLRGLGEGLGRLVSVLFRIGMLLLLLWYLIEFVRELLVSHHVILALMAVAVTVVTGVLVTLTLVEVHHDLKRARSAPSHSVGFLLLNLPPVLAVALGDWYGHKFSGLLLHFTQFSLNRIFGSLH